jgi:hypothetical protein
VIGLLVLAAVVAAADPEPDFDRFAGSCWVADFTRTMTDRHCFERILGGTHIRDTHEVREAGRVLYSGETTYSLDGGTVVFTYFNSLGGVGRGTVTEKGELLRFAGSMRASPDKARQRIDSEWRFVDEDHYEVRSLVKSPSTGGNQLLRFRRVK